MDATERWLALLYLFNVLCGSISFICMGIVWGYWAGGLDHCSQDLREIQSRVIPEDRDSCGCVLYGTATFTGFVGSDTMVCRFVTFAHFPAVLISCAFALYHGYRVCIKRTLPFEPVRKSIIVIDEGGQRRNEVICGASERPPSFYTAFAVNAGLFSILLFITAIVLTDGYYHSCNQYKQVVIKTIVATGNLARMIGERLSCGATFDYLDYIQPDTWMGYNTQYYYGGTGVINTGALLNVVLIFTWAHFATWIMVVILNVKIAKNFKAVLRTSRKLQPLNTDL